MISNEFSAETREASNAFDNPRVKLLTHVYDSGSKSVKPSGMAPLISSWLMRQTSAFGVRVLPQRAASLGSAQGKTRDGNQDRVLAASFDGDDPRNSFECYVVCDGMGGLQEGAQCASIAVASMIAHLVRTRHEPNRKRRLHSAVDFASQAINERYKERGGTTVAAVLVTRSGASTIAVGDTRIYLHDREGVLKQLTIDDTIAGRIAELQGHPADPSIGGPFANHLAQFVGQAAPLTPQVFDLPPMFGDPIKESPKGLLITTDGVHRMPKDVLSAVARTTDVPREMVSRLLYISEWCGGLDNESVVYLGNALRPSARQLPEGVPVLGLQDPFGEYQLSFANAEEFLRAEPLSPTDSRRQAAAYLPTSAVAEQHDLSQQHSTGTPAAGSSSRTTKERSVTNDVVVATRLDTPQPPEQEPVVSSPKDYASHHDVSEQSVADSPRPPAKGRKRANKGRKKKSSKDERKDPQPELDI